MDDADRAARLLEAEIDTALRRSLNRPQLPASEVCVSCGEDIGADRRAAAPNARRCVDCQNDLEKSSPS